MTALRTERKWISAWAARQVGERVKGHLIYGWGFEGVPPHHVRLFTNHDCTESIVVAPSGREL